MHIPIIYEDEFLLVIDKPSGVVVNRAQSVKEETIQDWAEKKIKSQISDPRVEEEQDFYDRAGIVHRLDKETSGLLIIAKNPQVFIDIQTQFKERKVTKRYKTLVHGKVVPAKGEIKASVGRLPWNRERFGILPGGREAATSFEVLGYYKHPDTTVGSHDIFSLLEVTPMTGRTHQIRIHLKYIGHTVVSDKFYAGRKTYREDIKFCPRLFLHAAYIAFTHPKSKQEIKFESALATDLRKVLEGQQKCLS